MNAKPKILIVDDKPENLHALRVVLQDLDIELIEALSGNEALRATLHHNFALALLDVQMPGMDGYELASILREEERSAQLPFIFISAVYTDNLNMFKGYENGAFSFITKPFQAEMLINKVKFFIVKHQQEAALLELNEKLKDSNKELEAFSYSVSHDLRAPLRHISGYVDLLQGKFHDTLPEKAQHYLNSIADASHEMGTLIDTLLHFSRTGRAEMHKSANDMNVIVNSVIKSISAKHSERLINWKVDKLPTVQCDNQLLKQVWVNLLGNAVKYSRTRANANIDIGVKEEKNEYIFYVCDNGVGFDMQYAQKLFGVFQRLHSVSEFEGTGIGLANVHRIISRHGGRTWAEAELDKGATFYFSLSQN